MSTTKTTRSGQCHTKQETQPTLENMISPYAHEQPQPPLDAHESLVKAHSHLVEISHLARGCYDEMLKHRSRYEQAYAMEQAKLAQSVAMCKGLETEIERLNQENTYYQRQLVPDYERLISSLRLEITHSEAKCRAREEKSGEELDEHRRATEAMIELLAASNERLEALEDVHQNTVPAPRILTRLQHQRRGKRQAAATLDKIETTKRRTRSKKTKYT